MQTQGKQIKTSLFIILSTIFLNVNSQNRTFSGFVEDLMTGEKIVGATIIEMNSKKNVVSNNYGFFSVNPNNDYSTYLISRFGYMPKTVVILRSMRMPLIIKLTPNNVESKEIVVTGSESDVTRNQDLFKLNIKESKSLPALLGETDIFKAAQLSPGIIRGNEGSNNLFVRGGNFDENMILLDGVPVISTNHMFGLFSEFNTDATRDFRIYKGSFPASYGGSLSSITEIFMKDGNVNDYHGIVDAALSSKFTLEGPITAENNSSFIVSGRRSYTNFTMVPYKNFLQNMDAPGFYFYDLNAKVTYKISDRISVSLSQYIDRDNSQTDNITNNYNLTSSNSEQLTWGNYLTALRCNYAISDNMFVNAIASYNAYRFQDLIGNNNTFKSTIQNKDSITSTQSNTLNTESQIDDYRVTAELTNYINASNQINYGFSISNQLLKPQTESMQYRQSIGEINTNTTLNNISYKIMQSFFYAEEVFHLNTKIDISAGVHFSFYNSTGISYKYPEPRFNLLYRPNEKFTTNFSVSKMVQYSNILSFSGLDNKTDLYVCSTQKVKPSEAWQADAGTNFILGNFITGFDIYYKTMKQLIELKDDASYSDTQTDWQNKIETGNGLSYGMELFIEKRDEKYTGSVSYTLSRSERTFQNLNSGKTFPFNYDRTHQLNANINYQILGCLSANALWVFSTGIPFSPRTTGNPSNLIFDQFLFSNGSVDNKNSNRLPAYHRLDLGLNYSHNLKYGKGTLRAGCYNVYNRKNIYSYLLEEKFNPILSFNNSVPIALSNITVSKQYFFPILPYVSYQFEF